MLFEIAFLRKGSVAVFADEWFGIDVLAKVVSYVTAFFEYAIAFLIETSKNTSIFQSCVRI